MLSTVTLFVLVHFVAPPPSPADPRAPIYRSPGYVCCDGRRQPPERLIDQASPGVVQDMVFQDGPSVIDMTCELMVPRRFRCLFQAAPNAIGRDQELLDEIYHRMDCAIEAQVDIFKVAADGYPNQMRVHVPFVLSRHIEPGRAWHQITYEVLRHPKLTKDSWPCDGAPTM